MLKIVRSFQPYKPIQDFKLESVRNCLFSFIGVCKRLYTNNDYTNYS